MPLLSPIHSTCPTRLIILNFVYGTSNGCKKKCLKIRRGWKQ
jgi:hypothetical protein